MDKKLIFTYDDGFTAIIKVWEFIGHFGVRQNFQTVHARK